MVAAAEKISLSLPSRSVVTIHHFSSDDAGTDWADLKFLGHDSCQLLHDDTTGFLLVPRNKISLLQ